MDVDAFRREAYEAVCKEVARTNTQSFKETLQVNAQIRSDRAVADLLRCDCIPIMQQQRGEQLGESGAKLLDGRISRGVLPPIDENFKQVAADRSEGGINKGAPSIQKSCSRLSTSSSRHTSMTKSSNSNAKDLDSLLREAYFWESEVALAILPADPLLEAGLLYAQLKMYDRSLSLLTRALASRVDSVGIVDQYFLPDTTMHQRKLSRLGKQHLEAYLSNRSHLRSLYSHELDQYQLRREHDIHCELFRLRLMLGDLEGSHRSLLAAFDTVDSIAPEVIEMQSPTLDQFVSLDRKPTPCEWRGREDDDTLRAGGGLANFSAAHSVRQLSLQKYRRKPLRVLGDQRRIRMYTLFFAHEVFMALLPYQGSKLSINEQLLRLSAGPLCEAHIVVLHELLGAVPDEEQQAEFAHHLGLRYAQKNDYVSSHKYFELSRTLSDPLRGASEQQVLGQRLSRSSDAERAAQSINQFTAKKPVRSFSYGEEKDRARQEERKDYTEFPGKHEGVTVTVYRTPGCGWEASVSERNMMRDKDAQEVSNDGVSSSSGSQPLGHRGKKSALRRPLDVQELIKSLQL